MSAFRSLRSSILRRPGSGEWPPILALIVLLGGLAAQLALPGRTELPADSAVAPRRSRAPVATPVPEYPAILRTPIFAPDRAPGETSGAAGTTLATHVQVLGVAVGGRSASAVVRDPAGASHVLRPGQSVHGWRLVLVTPRGAVFAGPGGRVAIPVGGTSSPPAGASPGKPNPEAQP